MAAGGSLTSGAPLARVRFGPKKGAGAPAPTIPKDSIKHEGKYVVGYSREHMKAWRQMPGQRHKEYTKDLKKQEAANPDDPTLATWPDGYLASVWSLTCAEFDAIEDTDKMSAKGTSVWQTFPTDNQRIWVSRPTVKNNVFCVHSKTDGVQTQMLQIKATSYGDSNEQVMEAEKLAVKIAQQLASAKGGISKEKLREIRDEALPTPMKGAKRPASTGGATEKKSKTAKTSPPTAKASASRLAEASGSGQKSADAEPRADKTDEPNIPSAEGPSPKTAVSSGKCGFCGKEPKDLEIYKQYNLCMVCYDDAIGAD